MEQNQEQRFPQEAEETGAEKTPAPAEEEETAEEKRKAFQYLIQNTYRQEYEEAVGKRIQAAIQQRFRTRQEQAPAQAQPADALRRHFESLSRQGEALREVFPGFDIMQEMRNPEFVRLTAPGTGVSVKDAFYALHGEEIQRDSMRYAAQRAGERLAASVQAGASRPLENGMLKPAPVSLGVDIRGMDKKTREEYRRRIHSGETINFTDKV